MINITDKNFEQEVLASSSPVVIDCYTEWCSPCRALKPLMEELSKNNMHIKFGLLNVEDNPDLAVRLRVTSVPKVVIFRAGEQLSEIVGVRGKSDYQSIIDSL